MDLNEKELTVRLTGFDLGSDTYQKIAKAVQRVVVTELQDSNDTDILVRTPQGQVNGSILIDISALLGPATPM